MRDVVHMSAVTTFIGGIIWLSVAVTAQASSLVSAERSLATVFSRNLSPAIDILRCFAVSEQQIGEHVQRIFMGETLALTSPADHQFEFRLTDDGLQQRLVSNKEWHYVDSESYRVLLTVSPEQRWQVFDAVQNIITGTSTTANPKIVPNHQKNIGQLIADEVRGMVDTLHRHDNLIIVDGVGLTGNLANFLKQPKNHEIAGNFYRQFLMPLIDNSLNGRRGKQALTESDSKKVSSNEHQALYASKLGENHFIYFSIDSSDQPEWIVINLLHEIENPHNMSIVGMARKAANDWSVNNAKQMEHRYPELIEVGRADADVKDTEIILRTLAVVRSIASDPQLVMLDKWSAKEINNLSFNELVDKYIDLIDGLYLMLFAGTEYDRDALFEETEKLFWAFADHLIVSLNDYPAMISFLQAKPKLVVNNMVYSADLLHLHYQKIRDLIFRLIKDFTKSVQFLEENNAILRENPVVISTLKDMGIDSIDDNKALANLLHNWHKKFSDIMELHVILRGQFSHYVNIELQYAQSALDKIKVQLLADEQEGWTMLGNDRKIVVTSQFAKFYQQHEGRITNFSLKKIVHTAGGLGNEMLGWLKYFSDNDSQTRDLTNNKNLRRLLELLGDPYDIKLVGDTYIKDNGSHLVINGIGTHYDIPEDARPIYQLTYWDHRIYVQAVELDNRIYLVFLNGFHKEAKHAISDQIRWMQKNRQSKAIVDAINILANIDYGEERQIAQFKLEQSARQLHHDQGF